MLKIFNTLTKQKEEFIPIVPNQINIYSCGQTVYDFCHLGHGRKAVVFDMIRRWLTHSGYQVTFVENITDIDDRIINKAIAEKVSIDAITERYIKEMHIDFDNLGILRPDHEPRATEYIEQMGEIIEDLINKGYAYKGTSGDIYYRVDRFKNYGKLSGRTLENLNAGERIEIDISKENPHDFVLWKVSKENEPKWETRGLVGRPGWHIECSAMAKSIFGKHFDIHGGGLDLQFPHHENEIAQSEAHNDCKLANYWIHNGLLNINDEKMSKSLGNFFTLREILNMYHPEIFRFLILRSHYRSPLNFTEETLLDAKNSLTKFYLFLNHHQDKLTQNIPKTKYVELFAEAMNDDFNTPLAISYLFELLNELNKTFSQENFDSLVYLARIFGILTSNIEDFLKFGLNDLAIQVEKLMTQRNMARTTKNYQLSDQIRDKLTDMGIIIEDSKGITTWRKA